jgi:hypothetical protein
MPQLTAVPDPSSDSTESQEKPEPKPDTRPRTSRPLPTDRIAFQKQLAVLRGFAVAATENGGVASANDVEKVIRMSHSTISLATPFFVDAGLLIRSDRGRFRPSEAVTEYTRGQDWSPESAGRYLRAVVAKSWFGDIIGKKVELNPRELDDVMAALAGASDASPDHRNQVSMLIDYAAFAGLVKRDGNMLRKVDGEAPPSPQIGNVESPPAPTPLAPEKAQEGVHSGFAQDSAAGYVEFHVNVKVRTAEFSTWRPERITAFFGGIAAVLAAKGQMEKDAGSN